MDLLTDLLNLQKDMMVMLLSMLEGNILNGPIGKQMVDTLMESQVSLEMILKFFDTFLKLANLTSSEAFMEIDLNGESVRRNLELLWSTKNPSRQRRSNIYFCVLTQIKMVKSTSPNLRKDSTILLKKSVLTSPCC